MNVSSKPSRNSPYHPRLSYRPPTPPNSFRNGSSNLWRSEHIHLALLTDSDSTPTNRLDLSKSSDSDERNRQQTVVLGGDLPAATTDCKSTQVDDTFLEVGPCKERRERQDEEAIFHRHTPVSQLPVGVSYHPPENCRRLFSSECTEFSDTSQKSFSSACRRSPAVVVECSADSVLNCCPELHVCQKCRESVVTRRQKKSTTHQHRQTLSKSLVLENSFSCPRRSPLPSDCSACSSRKFVKAGSPFFALSDSDTFKNKKPKYAGFRGDNKCSDSSTSSMSNASPSAVKRRSRTSNRMRSANRNSALSSDFCAGCSNARTCHVQSDHHMVTYRLSPTHAGDTNGLQKIRQLESEKKNLMLQVSVLNDQVEAQADKIRELEGTLESKNEQLRQMEQNLHQEIMARSAVENSKLEMITEISSLRLRLTASERDRKDSDERYRKIENDLQTLYNRLAVGDTDGAQSSFRFKASQNGTIFSHADRNPEIEKLHVALETAMASNEEKDKKIEDLRLSLIKYKKLQDFVLAGHQRKASDISLKDGQLCDAEVSKDIIPPPSPGNESTKSQTVITFPGKPPSGHRAPFTSTSAVRCDSQQKESALSIGSHSTVNSEYRSLPSVQSFHKSNSLENVRHTSPKTTSPKNSYGTIPRQSGPQVLQHLQEQLQNFECRATMPTAIVNASDSSSQSPTLSGSSKKQSIKEKNKEVNRGSRNKSSGISFGKGFFKLRSGKRSSSAPELAPFESVASVAEEREVSSASPTPQPTMQPFFIKPEKERRRGVLKCFTRWKSGSQNIEKIGDFRRGGIRATAGPRLGWSRDVAVEPDIPFIHWNNDVIVEWFNKIGLNMYISECRKWKCNGEQLLTASASEIEKELNLKNPLHKKKLVLCLQGYKSDDLPASINGMDYHWVVRWLDDIGLPQYKDSFTEARVDGRVLHYLTVDDLLNLKVTNQLHHVSIKRGIQILREKNFDPHCLIRRSIPDEGKNYSPQYVALWTNHRVMEWLRTVDLSEYAPNLRGSGVHGALIVYEPKFNTDLFATLLNIPPTKTLLRRHLATHFKAIVGTDFIQAKRDMETDQLYTPLTPNVKIKGIRKPQFVLKKRKSKSDNENKEFVCPMDIPVGAMATCPNGEKLIVRRNSDPTCHETRLLEEKDDKSVVEIGAVSKEITSLTDQLQEEKLLKSAPTTNV